MSNVKDIRITGLVPFHWLDGGEEGLPTDDIALVASLLLGPSMGLSYHYAPAGDVPNTHGGRTAMYRLSITGQEALSWPMMDRLASIIAKSGPAAELNEAIARDIENPGSRWARLAADIPLKPARFR